jgi:N-acyl-D-amino-acid deacylase
LDGKIARIAHEISGGAGEVIDAAGCVVSPGFIDNHSHSDNTCVVNKSAANFLEQGVTTEIVGQCGVAVFPFHPLFATKYKIFPDMMPDEFLARIKTMDTLDKFYDYLDSEGNGTNIASYMGHGMIRLMVMGMENRAPAEDEMAQMKDILRAGMKAGARGLSSGLIYPPGVYADTGELIELCKVVSEYGGVYATHLRDEGNGLSEAMHEAIRIGVEADVPVNISHLKCTGKPNFGRAKEALGILEYGNASGVEIYADQYPYTAGCNNLFNLLPPWHLAGSREDILKGLADPTVRAQIREELQMREDSRWQNILVHLEPEEVLFLSDTLSGENGSIYLSAYMAQKGIDDKYEAVFDAIETDPDADGVYFTMSEADVETIVRHPYVCAGTDSLVRPIPGYPGMLPRGFATFPRIIGHYCRDRRLMPLEECIRKLTSLPANKARLHTKGVLKTGLDADITVFDFRAIRDHAWYDKMDAPNEGILYVLVNGKVAVRDGRATGVLAGRAIR